MKYFAAIFIAVFSFSTANALVDMKNANFGDTWTDIKVPGSGYDLRVQRTYNSRTLFNGIFGFGWCSDFETNIFVTAEGNLKLTECGGGLEILYKPRGFSEKQTKDLISKLLKEVKKRNPSFTKKYMTSLRRQLNDSSYFREELTRQLGIEGKVSSGKTYFAHGRKNESIVFKGGTFTRTLPDGTYEKFNKDGQIVGLYDRNGNFLKITYKGKQIARVTDNNGRSLNFLYDPNNKKVRLINGPGGLSATYKYNKEDLIQVTNGWKQTFKFAYDKLHNLTKVNYPDGTSKALTYNQDKDWVTSFKDRRGCIEKYDYEEDKKDPLNHYWSTVTKTCKGKVTNKSRYEFWHKISKKGKRYLHRAKSDINGESTDVTYHPVFGKPVSITRNRIKIRYTYNEGGLIKSKIEPTKVSNFSYKNKCGKVSRVSTEYFQLSLKNKKRVRKKVRTIATDFNYKKPKCNLEGAKNSDGQRVTLRYDKRGRIKQITDQSKKVVLIKYDDRFGKPRVVTRPGLGAIQVSYKSDGSIKNVKSDQGPTVAAQVAAVFNNLLEIISPATSELSI